MARTKQHGRRGKNNPNRVEQVKDADQNRKPGVVKISDFPPELPVESFLNQLSPVAKFELDFRDFRSLYNNKIYCAKLPSEEHAIRKWEPTAELNKLRLNHSVLVPFIFQRKVQVGNDHNIVYRGVSLRGGKGRLEVIAKDNDTAVQALASMVIAKVFEEGALARFLFENYLHKMYHLIKKKRDPIELFEVPENMGDLVRDADKDKQAEIDANKFNKPTRNVQKKGLVVTSIDSFLGLVDEQKNGRILPRKRKLFPKVDPPIDEEYLYEMKKPQDALLSLGGNDCIESIKSKPIEGEKGIVENRHVFEASITLTGMETAFKALASIDKYAIEACAASILSEVFEKPKLAAKLLDKFQSSFNSSMPMLPVLYEDSSTDEGLPSDVLICRDKGPCGLIDVLLVSHGRPSSELSRDNLNRCLSPREALEKLMVVSLEKFNFFKYRMAKGKVDVIGCVHKDVKKHTKHQAYSSSAYVALQGACANYLSLHFGDSDLAREMLFRFDNTYCDKYKCYQKMKIKQFASQCHQFAINGQEFQSEVDKGEEIFQKCIANLNKSHFDTLEKMYKVQVMRMFLAGALENSDDCYSQSFEQKRRRMNSSCPKPYIPKLDPIADQKILPDLSNFTDLISDCKLKALECYMEKSDNHVFMVNLRVNDCFSFAALSENSAHDAMLIACKKVQIGLNSDENSVKEIQNDLAAMLNLLSEDHQVSTEGLGFKADVQFLEEYERFEATMWFRGQCFKAFSDLNKTDALRGVVAQCLKFANSQI